MVEPFKAGVGRANITPAANYLAAGGFQENMVKTINEEYWAQAMVLSAGGELVAIVSCDLTAIPNELVEKMRALIEEWTGIPGGSVLICATHVHGAPLTFECPAGTPDEAYLDQLVKKVATSVLLAVQDLKPAKIGAGVGYEDSVAFNRRLRFPDGSVKMNFSLPRGRAYPEATPLGPVDPQVSLLRVDTISDEPIGALVGYACHNIPNFAGELGKYMGRILDAPDFVALFLPGACGNINYIDHMDPDRGTSLESLPRISRILACEAAKVHQKIRPKVIEELKVERVILEIPERGFTRADELPGMAQQKTFIEERQKLRQMGMDKLHNVEIQAMALGHDIGVVTNPGQLFAEHGLAIKEGSPFSQTFVVCLANGNCGYVCARNAFQEGGYEPLRTSSSSYLAVDAGERIVESSVDLLGRLSGDEKN